MDEHLEDHQDHRTRFRTFGIVVTIVAVTTAIAAAVLWWKTDGQEYIKQDAMRRLEDLWRE